MADTIAQLVTAIAQVNGKLVAYMNKERALQAWVAPTLINSWTYFGSGYNTIAYWKDPWGVVHLKGLVGGGVAGTAIFTLPADYRPLATNMFVAIANGAIGRIDITAAGNVVHINGSTVWISLDGITFRAYQ